MRSALEREAARLLHELAAGRSVGARLRRGRELAEGLEQGARERFEQPMTAQVLDDRSLGRERSAELAGRS